MQIDLLTLLGVAGILLPSWIRDIIALLAKVAPPVLVPLFADSIQATDGHLPGAVLPGHPLLTARAATGIVRMKKTLDEIKRLVYDVHGPSPHGQWGLSLLYHEAGPFCNRLGANPT